MVGFLRPVQYPREEIQAMSHFYDGKRCVILRTREFARWAHILPKDASSEYYVRRLSLHPTGQC